MFVRRRVSSFACASIRLTSRSGSLKLSVNVRSVTFFMPSKVAERSRLCQDVSVTSLLLTFRAIDRLLHSAII
jgi:hypothetical protein